jgi:ABC-type branched-subunit amino acid transport system substrate-binding protein
MTKARLSAAPLAVLVCLGVVAAACSTDVSSSGTGANPGGTSKPIDYSAIGLWNDGPCDQTKPPLKIGLMTVFASPALSLKDQALALEASAKAFNSRGGANGSCIDVVTCDDGANTDQSLDCVRQIDSAGVVATVNDLGTAGQAEVSAAMQTAKIPRIASNVSNLDWADPNAYPMDASGTGYTFMAPQALIDSGIKDIGIVRVDIAAAAALKGLLVATYKDANFPVDVPIPDGTTDYSQFLLTAQNGGAKGVMLALGPQEANQVVQAGQQLNTPLKIATSLVSQSQVASLGDFSKQMVYLWSYLPATYDLPVYEALRSDLAVSGEEGLQPANLVANSMRSWIGLYALLWMIRNTHLTDFTRDNITNMLKQAKDVPMLGMFGGENWTPDTNHAGIYKRVGMNYWATWKWDPNAPAPAGVTGGNFVKVSDLNFDKVLCGSAVGAPQPC